MSQAQPPRKLKNIVNGMLKAKSGDVSEHRFFFFTLIKEYFSTRCAFQIKEMKQTKKNWKNAQP